ncbi:hypothetical protein ACQWU4_10700 [Chryseobacterium sp. MIQD13]|uniref:hypothetical protein n=1 Tax=Chryseobacterium sp. MIQD13 TaxID=3422310 RepID=UPI003D27CD5E
MKKIILLGSMALLTLSCGSDDDDNTVDNSNPSTQNVILPVKMSVDGESMKINYDGTKILNVTSNANTGNKVIFTYDGDYISSIKFYEANVLQSSTDYAYTNNLMTSAINKEYSASGVVEYNVIHTYTHVNANQINAKRQVISANTNYTMNSVYTYSGGNLITAPGTGSGTSNGVTTTYNQTASYNYTDKNYPFRNVKGFDKIIYNGDMSDGVSYLFSNLKNNISSYKENTTYTYSGGSGSGYSAYKFTTTFSSSGYPIYESRQPTDLNGVPSPSQPEIYTYEYNN